MATVRSSDDIVSRGAPAAAPAPVPPPVRARRGVGVGMAVLSAATFGTSGTFGDGLLRAGWTPGTAVLARIVVAALVLTPFALRQLRGRWHVLRRRAGLILAYGLIGVDGCTLCYFYAIKSMPVGVALLLEYLGAVLVVAWLWLRRGQRPRRLTIAGGVASIAGLTAMIGVTGSGGISAIGFMWGMLAAVSMAVFFFLSEGPTADGATAGSDSAAPAHEPLSAVVLSWAGMCVGAAILAILQAVRLVPYAASTRDVAFLSFHVSWILPVLAIGVLATAAGYVTGIVAVRDLGPKLASFIGMSEILFAALFAWLLLRQVPTDTQFAGSGLILLGLVLVRADES
ncbi:MAG TPA: EamA family transporter [Trebonia sp.]|jgi:drug/metabolite transporter (DMT)-like permease|nr:EamA family transporter [Trebonia sp.]